MSATLETLSETSIDDRAFGASLCGAVEHLRTLADGVASMDPVCSVGRVAQVTGLLVESKGPIASIGDFCHIECGGGQSIPAEVVGFRGDTVLLMPFKEVEGVRSGSAVISEGQALQVPVGEGLLGRVIDSLGNPIDGMGDVRVDQSAKIKAPPPHPLRRARIQDPFRTGIKALDTFVPCGVGQRLGIFAGSGVGKSTLLGMMAEHAEADVNIIAMIGERGREVREFLERDLAEGAMERTVVVVATSDESPILRLKGAYSAMSMAEHFRDRGQKVLLMMDSVTRFAMAQREIGLAVGELPATKGYPPSVFSILPQLLERAGCGETGSITGLFTVLVEGDDMNDPIADTVRSILDGHVALSRDLAFKNHYPAIDILQSVSRLYRELTDESVQALVQEAREALAIYHENREVIAIGAYARGTNPRLDRAIALAEPLNRFLKQAVDQGFSHPESVHLLAEALRAAPQPISRNGN